MILCSAAAMTAALTGCQPSPAAAVDGEYTPGAQSVQVNGIIINIADWPGCSVTLRQTAEDCADVTVDSLLPGFPSVTLPCYVTRQGRGEYSFTGSGSSLDRKLGFNGSIKDSRLTLSITDTTVSPTAGRWKVAFDDNGLADIRLSLSSSMSLDIPVDTVTLLLREAITPYLRQISCLELDRTGYVNLSWDGDISSTAGSLLTGVIQYYPVPESSSIHIYLRRSVAEGAGLPVSPLDFPLNCSFTSTSMTLGIDQDSPGQWLEMLTSAVTDFEYEDYTAAGSPFGDIPEETFLQYRSKILLLAGVLAMPGTAYSAEITFDRQ